MNKQINHYDWLDENLPDVFKKAGIHIDYHQGVITAHGDKCYGYKSQWEEAGIPFEHGVAIYLLTYFNPYASEVRETENGWVEVGEWVAQNYKRFFPNENQ